MPFVSAEERAAGSAARNCDTHQHRGLNDMWYQLQTLANKAQHHLTHMDRQEWIVVFVVAVLFGSLCLRGFGSRTGY
jgi:hypothetical protein